MSDLHTAPPIGAVPEEQEQQAEALSARPSDYDGKPSSLARTPKDIDWEKPHPLYCVWEITLKCDLGCKHCGSRAGKVRTQELSTAECIDVVHQLADIGVREVTLIGGEAYLRPDWPIIAKEITAYGMRCGMTTGARNLTQERVDSAVDAGVSSISISIDGLEETHDAIRGAKGSWRAALEAAERVAKTPMRLATNTQINRLSMPELPALADLLIEIGSRAWQLQLTVAMGRAADRPDMLPQPYDLLELFPLLVWIQETKLKPNGIQMFPGNNIGYFGPYEHMLRYGGDKGAHWAGCSAGKWTLGLEADGKIKGCPSLPSQPYTGGNFRTDKLKDVVANAKPLTMFRDRTRDDLWGYCKDCYYGDVCLAGCSWTTHCLVGKPGNNPYCIHRALQFEANGMRERVVKVEQAPGIPFDNGRFEIVVEPVPEEWDSIVPVTEAQQEEIDGLTEQAERNAQTDEAEILGVPLKQVTGLGTDAKSVWQKDHLKEVLKKR